MTFDLPVAVDLTQRTVFTPFLTIFPGHHLHLFSETVEGMFALKKNKFVFYFYF
jgi:hypothetical protein